MNITVSPGLLSGTVAVPSGKSYAHRLLIIAAMADMDTEIALSAFNDDIHATIRCLQAMGVDVLASKRHILVRPGFFSADKRTLDCGESGSTLRFLLPVAAALGINCTFTGSGRLPERPNTILTEALREHGVTVDRDQLPISISGQLTPGVYNIAGNVSSQYITGLLMALPTLNGDSEIHLTTALESTAYVNITLDCMRKFGVIILPTSYGWRIPGSQRYHSPCSVSVEGDWSSAAFWYAANAMGSSIVTENLEHNSVQGDRAIISMLRKLGGTIDVRNTPDLVPALSVAAARHSGTTRIVGAARLRLKESNRLSAIHDMLQSLGVACECYDDSLVIHGQRSFRGGIVDGCNDHRIVMAAAIAATRADGDVMITHSEAVSKSYPDFFTHFAQLGGKCR